MSNYQRVTGAAGLLALAASLASCEVPDPGAPAAEVEVEQSQLFAANGVTLWNGATSTNRGPLGTGVSIKVCFTVRPRPGNFLTCNEANPFSDCDRISSAPDPLIPGATVTLNQNVIRPYLKDVIQKSWGRAANIEFTEWGDCPIDLMTGQHKDSQLTRRIVIQFRANVVDQAYTGRFDNRPTVVEYNWRWLMKAATDTPGVNLFNHIHEFGHALGFNHEWQRADWPDASCPLTDGGTTLTSGIVGKCADVSQGATADGTRVNSSSCNGSAPRQRWSWGADLITLRAFGKCLDVVASGTGNGSKAEIRTCDGRPSQRWGAGANASLVNINSNRCLDVTGASTANGTQLQIFDCNGTAAQRWNVVPGDTSYTPPDPMSIMNYCGLNNSGQLSAWDLLGTQRVYGRKSPGSLVDGGGRCAGIAGSSSALGTPIVAAHCLNQANDRWFKDAGNQRFQANLPSSVQRCMGVAGGVVGSSPTPVISWTCDAGSNFFFPLVDMEWRGMGNMCATAGATTITMQPCDALNNGQKWTFMDGDPATPLRFDQIRLKGSNLCASVRTTAGALGETLMFTTCSATDVKQRFTFPGQGVLGFGNLCVQVGGGTTATASPLMLWDGCGTTPRPYHGQFSLYGNLKSLGQCLDSSVQTQMSVAPCVPSNPNQLWEYFF